MLNNLYLLPQSVQTEKFARSFKKACPLVRNTTKKRNKQTQPTVERFIGRLKHQIPEKSVTLMQSGRMGACTRLLPYESVAGTIG